MKYSTNEKKEQVINEHFYILLHDHRQVRIPCDGRNYELRQKKHRDCSSYNPDNRCSIDCTLEYSF
jgi:hypothetical protein